VTSAETLYSAADDRPRSARLPRLARRTQLLGAAQEVFVAQGYHAAAMDDIADRAGVSKPVLDQHCETLVGAVRTALASTTDNKQRVAATMDAYFEFVEHESGAFRLVFESDLTNEQAVRDRVNKAELDCAKLISAVITEDTGLGPEDSMVLAVGLTGISQVTARYWLSSGMPVPRDTAARLISQLAWRGIGDFPHL
jgi:AcrR family transcriptional regulator